MQYLIPEGDDQLKANNFDAIRLFLALAVVYSHSYSFYFGNESAEVFHVVTNGMRTAGGLAVQCFFIISGFLILHSYVRSRSLGDYLLKRVRRIHPGFIVAVIFSGLVIVPVFSDLGASLITARYIGSLLLNAVILRFHTPSDVTFMANPYPGAVNGSLWSIPFEFWCYLGLAGLGIVGAVKLRWTVVVLLIAVVGTRVFLDLTGRKPGGGLVGQIIGWPYLWFAVLPCFLLGMIVYLYRDSIPRSRWLFLAACVVPLGVAWGTGREWCMTAVSPICMSYCVFYVAFGAHVRLHSFGRYGDFSYGTYLYAFPLQQATMALLGTRISFPVYLVLCVIVSLLAGITSWYLVERRFLPTSRRHLVDKAKTG
jgi:peptidoglycan/LPS O-acetylase OafA/YrhL